MDGDIWVVVPDSQVSANKGVGLINANLGVVTSTRWRFLSLSTFFFQSAHRSLCNVHCITTLYPVPFLLCLRPLLKFFQSAPKMAPGCQMVLFRTGSTATKQWRRQRGAEMIFTINSLSIFTIYGLTKTIYGEN